MLPLVGDGYAVRVSAADVDLLRFRHLVATAGRVRPSGWRQSAELLDRALKLWRGPAFADLPRLAAHPGVVALEGERRAALTRYAELLLTAGEPGEILPLLQEAAAAQP